MGVSAILQRAGDHAVLTRGDTRNCHQPQGSAKKDHQVFWPTGYANLRHYIKGEHAQNNIKEAIVVVMTINCPQKWTKTYAYQLLTKISSPTRPHAHINLACGFFQNKGNDLFQIFQFLVRTFFTYPDPVRNVGLTL
jgi:hypothetical protein